MEATHEGIKIKDRSEGVYSGKDAVRNFKGLPPYEDKDWGDSKMLVSADLKVREERRDIVDTSRWPRETKIKAGIGALTKFMVRPYLH